MTDWSAYILAGGEGRRLGGRIKPLMVIDGRTIVSRQVAALATVGLRPSLVAPDARPFEGLGLDVVPDIVSAGALGALYTALHHSPTSHAVVLAGDLPFVPGPLLEHMMTVVGHHDVVLPAPAGRWQPLCGVYHRRTAPHFGTAVDSRRWRVIDALAGLDVRVVTGQELAAFDPFGRALLNVNTPDDYLNAHAPATP